MFLPLPYHQLSQQVKDNIISITIHIEPARARFYEVSHSNDPRRIANGRDCLKSLAEVFQRKQRTWKFIFWESLNMQVKGKGDGANCQGHLAEVGLKYHQ